jgi:hypothetical protein
VENKEMSEKISGTMVDLWEVRGQGDSDFGNAPTYTTGWYLTELEAVACAKGKGAWGSDGKINRHQVLKQDHENGSSSYYKIQSIEISPGDLEKMKIEALSKLTAADKKILGLG